MHRYIVLLNKSPKQHENLFVRNVSVLCILCVRLCVALCANAYIMSNASACGLHRPVGIICATMTVCMSRMLIAHVVPVPRLQKINRL